MPETERERLAKLEVQMATVLKLDSRISRLERWLIFAAGAASVGGLGGATSLLSMIGGS